MAKKNKKNGPGRTVEFLRKRYIGDDPARKAMLEQERVNSHVAGAIYSLRKKAGLSQRELAKRVGTSASVICQLEDSDYRGHSLTMLIRIATALDRGVEIRFPPLEKSMRTSGR